MPEYGREGRGVEGHSRVSDFVTQIRLRSRIISGSLGGFSFACLAAVGKTVEAGLFKAVSAGLTDRFSAAAVFIVGVHIEPPR